MYTSSFVKTKVWKFSESGPEMNAPALLLLLQPQNSDHNNKQHAELWKTLIITSLFI